MPSIAAYTPYETLKFCQTIAQHGAEGSAFDDIAATLQGDGLIRDEDAYDASKFTADALHSLYEEILSRERADSDPKTHGDILPDSSNPRKRKASSSPEPDEHSPLTEEALTHALVDRLYARFREEVIKEIHNDEAEVRRLQDDLRELEMQHDNLSVETVATPPAHKRQTSRADVASLLSTPDDAPPTVQHTKQDVHADNIGGVPLTTPDLRQTQSSQSMQQPPVLPSQHSPGSRPSSGSPQVHQHPPGLQHHQSPGAFHRQLPPPSPQRTAFAPPHHGFMAGTQGQPMPILPPPPGMQHMPPPMEYSNQKRPSTSTPARGSPMPQPHPQHLYSPYPPYQPPPQWSHAYPPPHGYPPPMPYPNQPYYMPPARQGSPYQTPHQSPYHPYPHTAPMSHAGPPPPGWHPSLGTPIYPQARSATTTPIAQARNPRTMLKSSGSSTPWKRRALPPGHVRPASPTRPDREVSPLTDTEESHQTGVTESKTPQVREATAEGAASRLETRRRRGRPPSATPSAKPQSRSQSIVSQKSETTTERSATLGRVQKVKTEPPSTPVPASSSDVDQNQRISGRRGRPRISTLTSKPEIPKATTTKRKRDSTEEIANTPPGPSSLQKLTEKPTYQHDTSLVLASKNFAKTSQLVLNEITSHKLANLFAKPLSERDAPGYRDLVLRPQDLKSIRTSVSKGSRAAVAAIEVLESEMGDESPTQVKNEQDEGSVGKGIYLIKKTADVIPPKGIVNSAQLEMELTRIFANAIMFNPLPTSERGFGRGLKISRNGGDTDPTDDAEAESSSESGSSVDDGGIVSDAREMFNDIVKQVEKWRDVELERVEGTRHGSISARQESVSSALHEEDISNETPTVEGTEAERGSTRKRRRIAE